MKGLFASFEKLSCNFYPAFTIYNSLYKNVIKREVDLANITSKDTVLNIGSGAIPFTAIHIVEMTGARVIAIDKDKEAVEKSKYCLKRFKLDRNIDVQIADGLGNFHTPFTVAIVALQVKEKEKVFENLINTAKPGGRLVFRQPSDRYKEIYGYLPDRYSPDSSVTHNMKAFKESYLFVKEKIHE